MQTFNTYGNQQVQFYNTNYDSGGGQAGQGQGPQNGPTVARYPATDGGVQPDDGDQSRVLKDFSLLTPLQNRYSALSGQLSGVAAQVSGVKGDVAGVAAQVSGVKGDVAGVSAQVADVQGSVTNVESKFAGVAKDVGQINKNIDTLQERTAQNNKTLAGIDTKLNKLETEVQQCCGSRHSPNPAGTQNTASPSPVTA